MAYIEVNYEIIAALQSRGFTSCEMVVLDSKDHPSQAIVAIIPGNVKEFELGMIPLTKKEISDYIDQPSPMAKYVIDESYLDNTSAPKVQ